MYHIPTAVLLFLVFVGGCGGGTTTITTRSAAAKARSSWEYEAPEPFEFLHDYCELCNPPVQESPDPLVRMTWNNQSSSYNSPPQIYRVRFNELVEYKVMDRKPNAAAGVDEFLLSDGDGVIRISQNCTLIFDWGVERAAWFELISPNDLSLADGGGAQHYRVQASLSEFNVPYPGKTKTLTKYGNYTYRLETNDELYEGIRFTFLHFEFYDSQSDDPTTTNDVIEITDMSVVAKVKPINYTGNLYSSDSELTRAWYTGAYGVRLNMEQNNFNSVLMERGDRVAIQGDSHPTIAAALVAFSPYDLVQHVLYDTNSGHKHVVDDTIMAYPLYWCLSSIEYFMESGDIITFHKLIPDIRIVLERRIYDFLDPHLDITWFGWDDRVGNGWCFHSNNDTCTDEALWSFAGLVIRVCQDFERALRLANLPRQAKKYHHAYQSMKSRMIQLPEYPRKFGVHAAANAINAQVPRLNEIEEWISSTFNDALTVCSFSQFNQYWILQALGNADQMERALASIQLCWGPMMKLGNGCFWELSSPEWLRFMKDGDQAPHLPSYCHPWASGVTAWLSHVLGGLQPTTPGYKEFAAVPYVSINYPSVRTTITAPVGKFMVSATLNETAIDGGGYTFESKIQSPVSGIFGIRFVVSGPSEGGRALMLESTTILMNGESPEMISQAKSRRVFGNTPRTNAHLFLRLTEGTNRIRAEYRSSSSVNFATTRRERGLLQDPPFPEPSYPAGPAIIDRQSQGDGLLKYGRDGYLLLGAGNGTDIEAMPSYIANVTVRRHGYPGWFVPDREFLGTSPTSPIFLPINYLNGTQRALGMVRHDGSGGGAISCVYVDVTVKQHRPYSLSVYFVAKSSENRHAVRVMDGDSLNLIAETTLIEDFENGVWLILTYRKSVRLRLMDIKFIHLSAIAFSST